MNINAFRSKHIVLIAILLVVVVFLTFIWLNFLRKSGKNLSFNIDQGESTREVAQSLAKEKVIFSPAVFSFYVYSRHILLQPGIHDLTASMKMTKIADILSQESEEQGLTIPEGYRLTQIDELASRKNLIKPGELNQIASSDEGYLFPDTYRFKKNITAAEIRQLLIDNFNKKTKNLGNGKVSKDVLTIASIVEREAKFDFDRAPIAGIYWSRLDLGMKLDADPTIQYGKGTWEPITVADYSNFQSLYNTYLNPGLPPTPICNPGLASIKAALFPVKDGSLYFFTDKTGKAIFSKTLEEHRAKIKN